MSMDSNNCSRLQYAMLQYIRVRKKKFWHRVLIKPFSAGGIKHHSLVISESSLLSLPPNEDAGDLSRLRSDIYKAAKSTATVWRRIQGGREGGGRRWKDGEEKTRCADDH